MEKDEFQLLWRIAKELRNLAGRLESGKEHLVEFETKFHLRTVCRDGTMWTKEPTGGRTITLVLGSHDHNEVINMTGFFR